GVFLIIKSLLILGLNIIKGVDIVARKEIKNPMDDNSLNNTNHNFIELYQKSNRMTAILNNLILESGGTSNLEVVQARGGHRLLSDRLNDLDSRLLENIIKGQATLNDFDEKTRRKILNMEVDEVNAVLGERNVQKENIALGAVSPEETSFFLKNNENIFDGEYTEAVYTYDFGRDDDFFVTANNYFEHDGRAIIFPVETNEAYNIKIFGEHDMFRLGVHNENIKIPTETADQGFNNTKNKLYTSTNIIDDPSINEFTFRNTEKGKFGILYISRTGEEPDVSITKDSYTIKNGHLDFKEIANQVIYNDKHRHATVIENPQDGYAPRPMAQSVTWVGPSEPSSAEPFDEWRETEGFIYFTDFTEYELDEKPHDWNEKFSTTTEVNKVITSRNYGGNVYWLRLET